MKKVLVGMSGGVDSAMSAYVLKEAGYAVTGVNCSFLPEKTGTAKEIDDAAKVAQRLGVDFQVFPMEAAFREKVINSFISSYLGGETPNPCIECNRHLKFGEMLDRALAQGFDYIATGHYVRKEYDIDSGRYILKKGLDKSKDQSYVLYTLTQHQLSHSLFPLGDMTKEQVRTLAEGEGFINARKKDSQDICFVPDGDYAAFIERQTGQSYPQGNYIDEKGNILGVHKGMIRYTVGQRKGLGIALGEPVFVQSKNPEDNTVVLGNNESLFKKELTAKKTNFIAFEKLSEPIRCKAKIRYSATEQPAEVTPLGEDRIRVVFDEPQRAISKGQAVVLYDGDTVLGGGIIE